MGRGKVRFGMRFFILFDEFVFLLVGHDQLLHQENTLSHQLSQTSTANFETVDPTRSIISVLPSSRFEGSNSFF